MTVVADGGTVQQRRRETVSQVPTYGRIFISKRSSCAHMLMTAQILSKAQIGLGSLAHCDIMTSNWSERSRGRGKVKRKGMGGGRKRSPTHVPVPVLESKVDRLDHDPCRSRSASVSDFWEEKRMHQPEPWREA